MMLISVLIGPVEIVTNHSNDAIQLTCSTKVMQPVNSAERSCYRQVIAGVSCIRSSCLGLRFHKRSNYTRECVYLRLEPLKVEVD